MKFSALLLLLLLSSMLVQAEDKPKSLSLKQAHEVALRRHPKISVAELTAMATKQVVNQAHSAFLPNIGANVGATAAADRNTRIVSLGLPMSSVYDRASASLTVSQLITDFGRSSNLERTAKFKALAAEQSAQATREQILLQVDSAYMGALQAQALVDVARQTIKTRKLLRDQVVTLAENQLKSDLDASFAEVNYQEAVLLLSRAENDLASNYATLAALMDDRRTTTYQLSDHPKVDKPGGEVSTLIGIALRERPDLRSARLERDAALKFAKAEAALSRPTLSLQGTAGALPYHEKAITSNDYAAGGIVLNWPVFTGGLNTARRKEAELRAKALEANVQDQETSVVRDVRIAWLNLINAGERITITAKLLEQAQKSEDLASARYNAGTTSMVELGQAQLSLTDAQINETNARYDYLLRRSILDFQVGRLK